MQQLKLFRPSDGPYKELCARFERTFSTSPNAARGIEFHQTIAPIIKGEHIKIPDHLKNPIIYAVNLYPKLIAYPIGVEHEVPLLDKDGEFITSGTIDLFGDFQSHPSITDWKTGQERDYWMQIRIYGVALIDSLFPPPRDDIEIDLTLAFVDQERHFTRTERYGELRKRVDSLVESISDPASDYALNQYCGYCDLRGTCPAWDRERAQLPWPNGDLRERLDLIRRDPVALARFIIALRRLNKLAESEDLDKLAIQYLKEGKDVPGLNVVQHSGKPVYDKAALADALGLWEQKYRKDFPVARTPYEYLKMTK